MPPCDLCRQQTRSQHHTHSEGGGGVSGMRPFSKAGAFHIARSTSDAATPFTPFVDCGAATVPAALRCHVRLRPEAQQTNVGTEEELARVMWDASSSMLRTCVLRLQWHWLPRGTARSASECTRKALRLLNLRCRCTGAKAEC